ncbi:MAG: dTDP-4-dehydrorhamnose 3,5-epimerase [Gemmatimonadetes bacterium]|nr:dTDP-4-dehydrorhamnose 3,5-epimerase [Gemmatimonadota bacterium]
MSFHFERLDIPDVVLIRPTRRTDARGFFQEAYRRSAFIAAGIPATFVQDNLARSTRGVLRGLHYQLPPAAQGKLVGVVSGRIWDVAVDLRAGSATYGRWAGRTLDGDTGELLWIPEGFAHGYVVLTDVADVAYKVTAEYDVKLDRGIRWDDPALGIDWPVRDPVLSEKDRTLPALQLAENTFR